jgi:predicted nuclease of predicted toxin-antitoxin system
MTPRWLLNENFPQPAVQRLRARGWDVSAICEDSPSIDDGMVMERARVEGRWLVTFDRDYGELVFKRSLPPPKLIVLLRVAMYAPEEPADWLIRLLDAKELREGFFHIFDGQTIRRRPLLADLPGGRA